MRRRGVRGAAAALGAGLSLMAGGCALFHPAPPLPPIIVPQPPILFVASPPSPAPMPLPDVLSPMVASDVGLVFDAPPAPPAPAPRREPSPEPERKAPAAAASDARPPQLSAELPPSQQRAYRGRVQKLLSRAQSELATLYHRNLDNEAAATRAQAGEFVRQAQQAIQQGDWVRAETLAQKADALARYLLGQ